MVHSGGMLGNTSGHTGIRRLSVVVCLCLLLIVVLSLVSIASADLPISLLPSFMLVACGLAAWPGCTPLLSARGFCVARGPPSD